MLDVILKGGTAPCNHRWHTWRWKVSGSGYQSRSQKECMTSVISLSHWISLGTTMSRFLDKRDNKYLPCLSHHWLIFLSLAGKCVHMFSYLLEAIPGNYGAGTQIQIFLTPKWCYWLLHFLPSSTHTEQCERLILLYVMGTSAVLPMVSLSRFFLHGFAFGCLLGVSHQSKP